MEGNQGSNIKALPLTLWTILGAAKNHRSSHKLHSTLPIYLTYLSFHKKVISNKSSLTLNIDNNIFLAMNKKYNNILRLHR